MKKRKGFTLIELMVIVGVIVVLLAILVPSIEALRRHAENARAVALLNTLRMGLSGYFSDHGMYPDSTSCSNPAMFLGAYPLTKKTSLPWGESTWIHYNRGSAMLAEGLTGYLPGDVDGAGPAFVPGNQNKAPFATDPGYGFRTRFSGMGGKVYGPYVPADRAYYREYSVMLPPPDPKIVFYPPTMVDAAFVDPWGNEILYYRSYLAPGSPGIWKKDQPSVPADRAVDIPMVFGDPTWAQGDAGIFRYSDCANVRDAKKRALSLTKNPGGGFEMAGGFLDPPLSPNTGTPGFWQQIAGGATRSQNGRADGRPIMGGDSFLLISAGPDGKYFTDDDLIMAK